MWHFSCSLVCDAASGKVASCTGLSLRVIVVTVLTGGVEGAGMCNISGNGYREGDILINKRSLRRGMHRPEAFSFCKPQVAEMAR